MNTRFECFKHPSRSLNFKNDENFIRIFCRGTLHQGQIEGGGKQCVCISGCFLAALRIPQTSTEYDNFLKLGHIRLMKFHNKTIF